MARNRLLQEVQHIFQNIEKGNLRRNHRTGNPNYEWAHYQTVRSGPQRNTSHTNNEDHERTRRDPSSHRQCHFNEFRDIQVNLNQERLKSPSQNYVQNRYMQNTCGNEQLNHEQLRTGNLYYMTLNQIQNQIQHLQIPPKNQFINPQILIQNYI